MFGSARGKQIQPGVFRRLFFGFCVLVLVLVLPTLAIRGQGWDIRWVAAYVALINALTIALYASDKGRAQRGEWRISEARLHLMELLGGWPGAWIAQLVLRHKSSKTNYRFVFWIIVLLYQTAAVDSLQDWKLTRYAFKWANQASEHRR